MADIETPNLNDYAKTERLSNASEVLGVLASQRFRAGQWVFRGQANASWPLIPSLERFGRSIVDLPGVIEDYAVREFQRRAHHYAASLPEKDSLLEWLALMRHHGSPTRLLDFTKSPYVAAFFATADAAPDEPAAIWAIDAFALRKHAAEVLKAETFSFWVSDIGKKCPEGNRFSEPEIFNMLARRIGPMPSVVAPVEPFRTNERMVLQQGLFLCPFSVGLQPGFEAGLMTVLQHARSSGVGNREILCKLVIEQSAHPHILRELHRMNVNHASLFPGLDGLARSLSNISKIRARTVPLPQRPDWEFDPSY